MKEITPIALTAENFNDYGCVISTGCKQPGEDSAEHKYWGKVSQLQMSNPVSTGVLIGKKRDSVVCKFERHLKTPEILVALEGNFVVCAAKPSPEGSDRIDAIRAFRVKQGEAFAMHQGIWHWIPFPVECENCKLLVVFASGTENNDLEVKDLQDEIRIKI